MGDYSPAKDSQAAYAAMPNQGLPTSTFNKLTPQQMMLASQLLQGAKPPALPVGIPSQFGSAMPPAQTPQAGQFIGQMGGR